MPDGDDAVAGSAGDFPIPAGGGWQGNLISKRWKYPDSDKTATDPI
jgi:hypothetical protein